MNKFYGEVGYGVTVETPPDSGVWKTQITEFSYYGDVIRNTRKLVEGVSVNDDITVGNSISIIADAYANGHFHLIQYAKWAGAFWKVTDVEFKPPRLILKLGEVYNGETA